MAADDRHDPMHAVAASLWPPAETAVEPRAGDSSWSWPAWVAFLAVCAVAGYQAGPWLRELSAGHGLAVLLGAVLSLWPNVILHEAGHALAGVARGLRVMALGVGPVRIERGVGGWHVRWGGGVRGISGFACLVPAGDRPLSKADHIVYLFGGPVANLLTAALGLALFAGMDRGAAAAFVLGVSLCAAILGVINLFSFESGGWRSDGRNLLDALGNRPGAAHQFRMMQLMQLSQAGVRPRDWPTALVPEPVDGSAPLMAANDGLMRLTWAIDRRDHEQAHSCAARVVPLLYHVPEVYRPHLAISVAGYVALMRPDAALLGAWLPLCEGGLIDLSPFRAWLHAEHAALERQVGRARKHIAEARDGLPRVTDPASAQLLTEYLDALVSRLSDASDEVLAGPAVVEL